MNELITLGAIAAGCAIGGSVVWLFLRARAAQAGAAARAELEPQLATLNERLSASSRA